MGLCTEKQIPDAVEHQDGERMGRPLRRAGHLGTTRFEMIIGHGRQSHPPGVQAGGGETPKLKCGLDLEGRKIQQADQGIGDRFAFQALECLREHHVIDGRRFAQDGGIAGVQTGLTLGLLPFQLGGLAPHQGDKRVESAVQPVTTDH